MTQNHYAVHLAKLFFQKTGRRATKATMGQSINQAKSLLDAGFNVQEIEQGIDWCIKVSPPKGFNSLGWLSYDLENILLKIKAKEVKQSFSQESLVTKDDIEEIQTNKIFASKERVSSDFNFDIFNE